MRGSGLSLERFIKGKAHKTKGEAKSKKRVIVHKALRRREYEKVKRREAAGGKATDTSAADVDEDAGAGGSSFYDRFFKDLQSGKVSGDVETEEQAEAKLEAKLEPSSAKPDPFFKARKKADVTKQEKQRAREERTRRQAEQEKKLTQRKKRHVKLSVRTASGQPVVRNHIGDILSKLQAEKAGKTAAK